MATHRIEVSIERDDRSTPVKAGAVEVEGQDYEGFDDAAAREYLIANGILTLDGEWVSFLDTIAPFNRIDRIIVRVASKRL